MRKSTLCAVGIVSLLFVSIETSAHHAFSSEFNPNKVLMINGTISEVSWANPHVAVKIAVKDGAGHSELWTVRGDSPVILQRNGWNSRALVVGQQLAVCGYAALGGKREMSGEQVALATGVRMLFATTEVRSCFRVDLRRANEPQDSGDRSGANASSARITNPVGAMGNPILPMGNPIPPAGNPLSTGQR